MLKEKKQPEPQLITCSICGQEISGYHVYIKTKRGTELRIHYGCIPAGKQKKEIKDDA